MCRQNKIIALGHSFTANERVSFFIYCFFNSNVLLTPCIDAENEITPLLYVNFFVSSVDAKIEVSVCSWSLLDTHEYSFVSVVGAS